jgi:IS5 family transposase
MALLQTRYGLSDYEVEGPVNNRISFGCFVEISLDDSVPDQSVLSRFRTEMTQKNVYDKLFKAMTKQLEKHKIIVKTGAMVDASIIDSPLKPKGQTTFEIENDRSEEERSDEDKNNENAHYSMVTKTQKGADPEGRWIKKSGVTRFDYKKHAVTDEEDLILGILTIPTNVHEISNLKEVLVAADLPDAIYLYTDKGCASAKNEKLLKARKIKAEYGSKPKLGEELFNLYCLSFLLLL